MKAATRISIAEKVKELREERGLSRQQLADALGLSLTAIAGYEQGYRTPKLDNLQDLSSFFRVPIEYILGATDEKSYATVNNIKVSDTLLADFISKVDNVLDSADLPPQEKREKLDLLLTILESMIVQGKR